MHKEHHHQRSKARRIILLIPLLGLMFFLGQRYLSRKMTLLLPELIERISEGAYRFDYQSINLRFIQPEIRIVGARLTPVDTSLETAYQLSLDSFSLRLTSIWPLLFQQPVQVQTVRLVHPDITAHRMHVRSRRRMGELHMQVRRMKEEALTFLKALSVDEAELVGGTYRFYPFPDDERHFQLKNIHFFVRQLRLSEQEHSIKASIRLELNQPELILPDTTLSAGISRFYWDSQTGKVDAGDLYLTRHPGPGRDRFNIRLDAVQLRNIHWAVWLDSGIVRLDTLLAKDGILQVSPPSSPRTRKAKRSPVNIRQLKFWDAIGNLDIDYFAARKLQASLVQQLPGRERDYSLQGDSLIINRLSVRPLALTPLYAADLAFSVRTFTDKGAGNRYRTSFSRLHLSGNTLELNDYRIASTGQSALGAGSSLTIPAVFLDGISFQGIFDNKARIRQITMKSPILRLQSITGIKRINGFSGLEDIRPYLDVDLLRVRNASFFMNLLVLGKAVRFSGSGFSADVKTREALTAQSPETLLNSLREVFVDSFQLSAPSLNAAFQLGTIDYRKRSVRFGQAQLHSGDGTFQANLTQIAVDAIPSFRPLDKVSGWSFKKVEVGSGTIQAGSSTLPSPQMNLNMLVGGIDTLRVGTLAFLYSNPHARAQANFTSIQAYDARLGNGQLSWQLANAAGKALQIDLPGVQVNGQQFQLNANGESVLDSARIRIQKPGIDASIAARQVITREKFRSFNPDTLVFDRIALVHPVVHAILSNGQAVQQDKRTFLVGTSSFALENLVLQLSFPGKSDPLHLETRGHWISGDNLFLDQVNGNSRFSIGRLLTDLDTSTIRSEGQDIFRSGSIAVSFRDLIREPGREPVVNVEEFSIRRAVADWVRRGDTLQWNTNGIRLKAVNRLYLQKDSILRAAFKLPPIFLEPGSFVYHTPKMKVDVQAFEANTEEGYLQWDSLNIQNRTPRDQFFKEQPFEKDYISFSTGRLRAENLRPLFRGKDTVAYARKLLVNPLHLRIERDKRVADDTIRFRPLLAGMLNRLPFPILLDTLQLQRSVIWHNLIDEKTEKEGTIFFTDMEALLLNVRNTDITVKDSIRLLANSRLMGKGQLQMRYQESYTDPRKAFHLLVGMGEMNMQELNRLIVPLQNVRADDGKIQRLSLQVKGTDSIAWGTIRMEYDKLKISVINKEEKRQSLISFLANLFVRGKNTRTNRILTERLPEKAVFNYWSRISLNGLLTSLGVRTNNKQNRQFFRKLEKNSRAYGSPSN